MFTAPDDYYSCRDNLRSPECPYSTCITRERAVAQQIFKLFGGNISKLDVHEVAPISSGLSSWLIKECQHLVRSGYFPEHPFGATVEGLRNEDLEKQTFRDGIFDLVIHLDVMEHLFHPFHALGEINRTLRPGGVCIFSAPTYSDRETSEQVAFHDTNGVRVVGEPEYHGNPQGDGSLVTWRYGHDLPLLISRTTPFSHIEVSRQQSQGSAIMGPMADVYILQKAGERRPKLAQARKPFGFWPFKRSG